MCSCGFGWGWCRLGSIQPNQSELTLGGKDDDDREVIWKPRAGLGVPGRVGGSRNGGFPELVGNMGSGDWRAEPPRRAQWSVRGGKSRAGPTCLPTQSEDRSWDGMSTLARKEGDDHAHPP